MKSVFDQHFKYVCSHNCYMNAALIDLDTADFLTRDVMG